MKEAIDEMRAEGKKVGLLDPCFLPVPDRRSGKVPQNAKRVAVLDKNISLGAKGATLLEVKDALYGTTIPVKGTSSGLAAAM